jgi:predicted HicB family RNase H-like nuclease
MDYTTEVPKKKPEPVKTTLRLEPSLYEQTRLQVARERTNLNALVARLLTEYLRRKG